MDRSLIFFSGAFLANGIPHFVNGVSGKEFVRPFLYRFMPWMPNPLFNALWGLLWFALSFAAASAYLALNPGGTIVGVNANFLFFSAGFVAVSLFLSLFFAAGGWRS